jgi:hypothetical protein
LGPIDRRRGGIIQAVVGIANPMELFRRLEEPPNAGAHGVAGGERHRGTGLWPGSEWLRRTGLLGIALVIDKVPLSDMAELEGVLRALSFLGLGAALAGLGYAYRRLRPAPVRPWNGSGPGSPRAATSASRPR